MVRQRDKAAKPKAVKPTAAGLACYTGNVSRIWYEWERGGSHVAFECINVSTFGDVRRLGAIR